MFQEQAQVCSYVPGDVKPSLNFLQSGNIPTFSAALPRGLNVSVLSD